MLHNLVIKHHCYSIPSPQSLVSVSVYSVLSSHIKRAKALGPEKITRKPVKFCKHILFNISLFKVRPLHFLPQQDTRSSCCKFVWLH